MYRREFLKTAACSLGGLGFAGRSWAGQVTGVDPDASKAASAGANGIYLNQIGFPPDSPKLATISAKANSFLARSLKDDSIVLRSVLSPQRMDAASGDQVRLADFSAVKTPGQYRLELDTGAVGDSFPVRNDAYDNALLLAMRSFCGQRCGCTVDLGGGYSHPQCHLDAAFHPSSGKTGPCDIHGGWHDAGDYSRFMINASITTGTLLLAWELYGASLQGFALQIPESGGKVPDFLAEIQWNLQWMLALQDSDGGVWQKQSREDYCSFIMPQDELGPNYIIGTGSAPYKSTCASADLAAIMAIAARCYSSHAPQFSQQCLKSARSAWAWCQSNPKVFFKNPDAIHTAEFADTDCHDELLWAAAELWRTTGDATFHQAFTGMLPQPLSEIKIDVPSPMQVGCFGYWSYALAARKGSPAAIAAIHQATLKMAGEFVHQGSQNGYGNSLTLADYAGGSNSIVANHCLLLLVANQFEPDRSHLNCVLNNLHYLLGRNCLGISWVTQIGSRSCRHPHHRPSVADNVVAPWPGLLSNGPNADPSDPITKALPRQTPMRMYVDDERAWSSNEPMINCNAPLVFVLAALYAQQRHS